MMNVLGIIVLLISISLVSGQSSHVLFTILYDGMQDQFESRDCSQTTVFSNMTQLDVDQFGRRPYFDCKCHLRTTFETHRGNLKIEMQEFNLSFFQDQGQMISFERQGSDFSQPGSALVVIDGTTHVRSLPVTVHSDPEGELLDMICSQDGSQQFETPQLIRPTPEPTDPASNNSKNNKDNKNDNNTIIIVIVVIIIVAIVTALLIIAVLVFIKRRRKMRNCTKTAKYHESVTSAEINGNDRYSTHVAVTSSSETGNDKYGSHVTGNYDEEGGVSYADIDPKSLAKRDPEKMVREAEWERQRNDEPVEYAEVAFQS